MRRGVENEKPGGRGYETSPLSWHGCVSHTVIGSGEVFLTSWLPSEPQGVILHTISDKRAKTFFY